MTKIKLRECLSQVLINSTISATFTFLVSVLLYIPKRGNRKFYWGDFFTEWRKPEEEWFWRFGLFSKLKTAFCEYWTSSKIWTMCPKGRKLKQKWCRSNDYSSKCCFYWVITWKLLFSGGGEGNWLLLGGDKNLEAGSEQISD